MRWWGTLSTLSRAHWRASLLGILLLAMLGRAAIIIATPHFVPWGDPADFQRNALSIATGHGMAVTEIASPGTPSAYRPPAYPFLLGGAYALFGIHLWVGRAVSAVLGTLSVLLLMLLAREIWDRRVALLAGLVAAVYLPLIGLNATLLSESLFVPLELAIALCLLKLSRASRAVPWALLAGGLCAAAAMTRTVGLLWVIPCLLVIVQRSAPSRSKAVAAVAAIGGLVVVLIPWIVRDADVLHTFVPISTQDGFTLAGQYNSDAGHDDQLQAVWRDPLDVASLQPVIARLSADTHGTYTEAQLDSALQHAALSYLSRHPGQVAVSVWLNSLRLFDLGVNHEFTTSIGYREMGLPQSLWRVTTLSAQLIGLLALLTLAARLIRLRFAVGPWWLWALPLLAIAATVVTSGTPRYRAPADPFLILFAVVGVSAWLDGRRRPADSAAQT